MKQDTQVRQQGLLNELTAFLDARSAELERTLARLDALRAGVIRRDEKTLSEMLEQVRQEADAQASAEAVQRQLQRRLAEVFGFGETVTVSRLCAVLDAERGEPLREKQRSVLALVNRVQNEHAATEMLLRECARCNRHLLEAILGRTNQTATYDPQGQNRWDVHRGLVSMKL